MSRVALKHRLVLVGTLTCTGECRVLHPLVASANMQTNMVSQLTSTAEFLPIIGYDNPVTPSLKHRALGIVLSSAFGASVREAMLVPRGFLGGPWGLVRCCC